MSNVVVTHIVFCLASSPNQPYCVDVFFDKEETREIDGPQLPESSTFYRALLMTIANIADDGNSPQDFIQSLWFASTAMTVYYTKGNARQERFAVFNKAIDYNFDPRVGKN